LENLPNELIQDILSRSNLDEISGLCQSNKKFRENCNYVAETLLKRRFSDLYKAYHLTKFSTCIITNDGLVLFTEKTDNIRNIPDLFIKRIKKLAIDESYKNLGHYDVSWKVDNDNNPTTLTLDFHYYNDENTNFNVIIHGDLVSYKMCEKLGNVLANKYEQLLETL